MDWLLYLYEEIVLPVRVTFVATPGRIKLQKTNGFGTLVTMKRWQWFVLIIALLAVGWYFFYYRGSLRHETSSSSEAGTSFEASSGMSAYEPAKINWQSVERPQDGFKLEMPAGPKSLQIPAYNEVGSTEPIDMLYSSPDNDTTYSITWEDNPPVARANDHVPDKTLQAAAAGMMARTQTTLVRQSSSNVYGAPALDVTAKNSQGGVLDARLIYIHNRLYTLVAAFPSEDARREQDVVRFFNSFNPLELDSPAHAGRGGTS